MTALGDQFENPVDLEDVLNCLVLLPRKTTNSPAGFHAVTCPFATARDRLTTARGAIRDGYVPCSECIPLAGSPLAYAAVKWDRVRDCALGLVSC